VRNSSDNRQLQHSGSPPDAPHEFSGRGAIGEYELRGPGHPARIRERGAMKFLQTTGGPPSRMRQWPATVSISTKKRGSLNRDAVFKPGKIGLGQPGHQPARLPKELQTRGLARPARRFDAAAAAQARSKVELCLWLESRRDGTRFTPLRPGWYRQTRTPLSRIGTPARDARQTLCGFQV
jgi:hypothetical protein